MPRPTGAAESVPTPTAALVGLVIELELFWPDCGWLRLLAAADCGLAEAALGKSLG
jgi:hypothetical protein